MDSAENHTDVARCSYCGSEIESDVSRCKYCASLLDKPDTSAGAGYSATGGPGNSGYSAAENQGSSSYYNYRYINERSEESGMLPLSNGLKVFLVVISSVIPAFGQLAGIITALVFMMSGESDRKSFGIALLVSSIVMFMLSCIGLFIAVLAVFSITTSGAMLR